jgi:hypothetical protein
VGAWRSDISGEQVGQLWLYSLKCQRAAMVGPPPGVGELGGTDTMACVRVWAKLVGAAGGDLWVVTLDDGSYDAHASVAYTAWLDGAGDSYDVVRERRRSGPWSWWERQMTSDD